MLNKIRKQYILLDTSVIINAVDHPDGFAIFFDDLKKNEITPGYDPVIHLEFVRTSKTASSLSVKNKYLQTFFGGVKNRFTLPVTANVIEYARNISLLSNHLGGKKGSNISLGDSLIAAQLKDHQHTYLATCNIKDFTTKLFDRIGIYTVEGGDNIFPIGIYCFSQEKYNQAVGHFNVS